MGGKRSGLTGGCLAWGGPGPLLLLCLIIYTLAVPVQAQDPVCGDLGPGECMARSGKCQLIRRLVHGRGGPVKGVFQCARIMGIPKPQVIAALGPAFSSGHPETIIDRVIPNDSDNATQFRRCVLTHAGLLTVNGTIARTSMINTLLARGKYTHPAIIDTVAAAITNCPEPQDFRLSQFLGCVRTACIQQMPPGISYLPTFGLQDDHDDNDDDNGSDENDD